MFTSEQATTIAGQITELADRLESVVAQLVSGSAHWSGTDEEVARMFASAVEVFGRLVADPQSGDLLEALGKVTPTDASTAAASLLRSQDLTPFEFSVWMQATAHRETL